MAKQKIRSEDSSIEECNFICTKKCFFDSQLWDVGEETAYIPGIENSPYFEQE